MSENIDGIEQNAEEIRKRAEATKKALEALLIQLQEESAANKSKGRGNRSNSLPPPMMGGESGGLGDEEPPMTYETAREHLNAGGNAYRTQSERIGRRNRRKDPELSEGSHIGSIGDLLYEDQRAADFMPKIAEAHSTTFTADSRQLAKTVNSSSKMTSMKRSFTNASADIMKVINAARESLKGADEDTATALRMIINENQERLKAVNSTLKSLTLEEQGINAALANAYENKSRSKIKSINKSAQGNTQLEVDKLNAERDRLLALANRMDVTDPARKKILSTAGKYEERIKVVDPSSTYSQKHIDKTNAIKRGEDAADAEIASLRARSTSQEKIQATLKTINELTAERNKLASNDVEKNYYNAQIARLKIFVSECRNEIVVTKELIAEQQKLGRERAAAAVATIHMTHGKSVTEEFAALDAHLADIEKRKAKAVLAGSAGAAEHAGILAEEKVFKNLVSKKGDRKVLEEIGRYNTMAYEPSTHAEGSWEANAFAQKKYLELLKETVRLEKEVGKFTPQQKAQLSNSLQGLTTGAFNQMRATSAAYLNAEREKLGNLGAGGSENMADLRAYLVNLRQTMSETRAQIIEVGGRPGGNVLRTQLSQQRQLEREVKETIRENIRRRVTGQDTEEMDTPKEGKASINTYAQNISEFTQVASNDINERYGKLLHIVDQISNGLLIGAGAVGALAFKAVQVSASFEATRVTMGAILKDTGAANNLVKDIMSYSLETPFQFDQLTDMTRQLLAFGYTAKETMPMLKSIVDAVTAVGGDRGRLTRIIQDFGKMKSSGVINSREMLQLTQAGLPAWEILANDKNMGYGGDQEKLRKDMQQRKVKSPDAIKALTSGFTERYGGVAEERMQTTQGKMENFQERVTFAFMKLGEALLPLADGLLDIGTQFLNLAGNPGIKTLLHVVGQMVFWGGLVGGIVGKLLGVVPMAVALAKGIGAGVIATYEMAAATSTQIAANEALIASEVQLMLGRLGYGSATVAAIAADSSLTKEKMIDALVTTASLTPAEAELVATRIIETRVTTGQKVAEDELTKSKLAGAAASKRLMVASIWIAALTVAVIGLSLAWEKWKPDSSAEASEKSAKANEDLAKSFEKTNNDLARTMREIERLEKMQNKNGSTVKLLAAQYELLNAKLRAAGVSADKLANVGSPQKLMDFARDFMKLNIDKQMKALEQSKIDTSRAKIETALTSAEGKDNPSVIGRTIAQYTNAMINGNKVAKVYEITMFSALYKQARLQAINEGKSEDEAKAIALKPFVEYEKKYLNNTTIDPKTGKKRDLTYDEILVKNAILQSDMYTAEIEAAKKIGSVAPQEIKKASEQRENILKTSTEFATVSLEARTIESQKWDAEPIGNIITSTVATKENINKQIADLSETNKKLAELQEIKRKMMNPAEGYIPEGSITNSPETWTMIGESAPADSFQAKIEREIKDYEAQKSTLTDNISKATENLTKSMETSASKTVVKAGLTDIPTLIQNATMETAKYNKQILELNSVSLYDSQGNKIANAEIDTQVAYITAQIASNTLLINKLNEVRAAKLLNANADKVMSFFIQEIVRDTEFGSAEFDKYNALIEKIKSHIDALKASGQKATPAVGELNAEILKLQKQSDAFQAGRTVVKAKKEADNAYNSQGYLSVANATAVYDAQIAAVQANLKAGIITDQEARDAMKIWNTAKGNVEESGKQQEDIINMWKENELMLRQYSTEDFTGVYSSMSDKATKQMDIFNKILTNMALRGQQNTVLFKKIKSKRDEARNFLVTKDTNREYIDNQFADSDQIMQDNSNLFNAQLGVWSANQSPTNTIEDKLNKRKASKDLEIVMEEKITNDRIRNHRNAIQMEINDLRRKGQIEEADILKEGLADYIRIQQAQLKAFKNSKDQEYAIAEAQLNRLKRLREVDSIDALSRITGMSAEQVKWMKLGRDMGGMTDRDKAFSKLSAQDIMKNTGSMVTSIPGLLRADKYQPINIPTRPRFAEWGLPGFDKYNDKADVSDVYGSLEPIVSKSTDEIVKKLDTVNNSILGISKSDKKDANVVNLPYTITPKPGESMDDAIKRQQKENTINLPGDFNKPPVAVLLGSISKPTVGDNTVQQVTQMKGLGLPQLPPPSQEIEGLGLPQLPPPSQEIEGLGLPQLPPPLQTQQKRDSNNAAISVISNVVKLVQDMLPKKLTAEEQNALPVGQFGQVGKADYEQEAGYMAMQPDMPKLSDVVETATPKVVKPAGQTKAQIDEEYAKMLAKQQEIMIDGRMNAAAGLQKEIRGSSTQLGTIKTKSNNGKISPRPLSSMGSGTRGGTDIKLTLTGLAERLFKVLERIDEPGGTGGY